MSSVSHDVAFNNDAYSSSLAANSDHGDSHFRSLRILATHPESGKGLALHAVAIASQTGEYEATVELVEEVARRFELDTRDYQVREAGEAIERRGEEMREEGGGPSQIGGFEIF